MPGIVDADRRLKFMRAKFGNQEAPASSVAARLTRRRVCFLVGF